MPFGRWNEVNADLAAVRMIPPPSRPQSARSLIYPPLHLSPSSNKRNGNVHGRESLHIQELCDKYQEEIRYLNQQLKLKDKCINDLETQIKELSSQIRRIERPTSTRKGSCGGISDTSDATIQFEESSPSLKLQASRWRLKAARSHASARPTSARSRPESQTRPRARDDIDQVVQEYLKEVDQAGRIRWVSYGVYLMGNKKIGVTIKNGKPLVRIGGGAFVHLEVYLVTH